jgi:hypothetical protein
VFYDFFKDIEGILRFFVLIYFDPFLFNLSFKRYSYKFMGCFGVGKAIYPK